MHQHLRNATFDPAEARRATADTIRVPSLERAMKSLVENVEGVGIAARELGERLGPVLIPEKSNPIPAGERAGIDSSACPLSQDLERAIGQLRLIREDLACLLGRLDL
jgi:hypothetical protein